MTEADRQAPSQAKRLEVKEVFRRWDWLLTAMIAPAMLFPGTRQTWALMAVVFVILLQGWVWKEVLPVTPLNPAILLLAIMAGVSLFVTPDLVGSLGKIAGLVFGIAVYFSVVRHARSKEGWKGALVLFILVGTGIALVGLMGTGWFTNKITWFNHLTAQLPIRLMGMPGAESGIHPNELAGALLWVIPVIFMAGLAYIHEPRWFSENRGKMLSRVGKYSGWTVLLVAALIIEVGVLALSQSRGGYLALALTGVLMLVLLQNGSRRWWAIGVMAVIGLVGAILIYQLGMSTITDMVTNSTVQDSNAFSLNSLGMRLEIWARALWAIKAVPLTGLGMNVFRSALYQIYPTFTVSANFALGHAHNELLQAALDLGIPGLVGFLALFIGAVAMTVGSIRAGGVWRLLALGVLGGLLAHFLFGLTDAVALGAKPGFLFWWLLGMSYGMYYQIRSMKEATDE